MLKTKYTNNLWSKYINLAFCLFSCYIDVIKIFFRPPLFCSFLGVPETSSKNNFPSSPLRSVNYCLLGPMGDFIPTPFFPHAFPLFQFSCPVCFLPSTFTCIWRSSFDNWLPHRVVDARHRHASFYFLMPVWAV